MKCNGVIVYWLLLTRFDLTTETIIWSNGTFYVNAMRPGMMLNILPVDGALHKTEDPVRIADLAEEYEVESYSAIINSDYNNLRDATPDMILPEGIEVVIEGGTGSKEPVFWDPRGGAGTTVDPIHLNWVGLSRYGSFWHW